MVNIISSPAEALLQRSRNRDGGDLLQGDLLQRKNKEVG